MKPRVNVLYAPGTNCEPETVRAFKQVGADPQIVFLSDLLTGAIKLDSAEIICLPGGFSYGDHMGSGCVVAVALKTALAKQFRLCQERLMLCICNGYQIALRAGCFGSGLLLAQNSSGTFINRPVQEHLVCEENRSPWLTGLGGAKLAFPCAHGEGRFLYGQSKSWSPAFRYPVGSNPDGSMDDVAGITSPDGRFLGIMDHPERAPVSSEARAIFANGVAAVRG